MYPVKEADGPRFRATFAAFASRCRGVFSDVDDTLTTHGKLLPAAYANLVEASAAGMRIVLVTGRPVGWAEVMVSLFPIAAAVAENGAVAALPGGERMYFEDEASRSAGARRRDEARRCVARELPHVRAASDQPLRDVDLAFDINETMVLPAPDVARLVEVLQGCGLSTTRSSIHCHATYSLGDKAKMSCRVAERLWNEGVDTLRSEYLFVGDSPNDAPAFRFFEHAVGVANVERYRPALLAANALPWAVTCASSGEGFAEVLGHLLAERPHR